MVLDRRHIDNRFGYTRQLEENPFDRDSRNVPLMRFVLHSTSLADEILFEDSPAHRLVKVSCLKEIDVIPLPTTNNDMRKRFADNGLVLTEYFSHESSVVLKISDGSNYDVVSPFIQRLPENLWTPIIDNSVVTLADLFASNVGDYLVVSKTEPSLKCRVARNSIITAEQALETVRIILTAHSRFYVGARIPVSEWFYYLYRFRKLFKEFHRASTVATHAHGKGLSEEIHDYFVSLGTRLDFICRAYDKVAFFSLKTANYDDLNNQLYHLAYFTMLITGVFDDLAHIIAEFYYMKIKGRKNISLRIPLGARPNKFYQTLQLKNDALYEFLTALDTQRDINAFYPLRDSLQHRELPTGMQLHEMSEIGKNVFALNSETTEELNNICDSLIFIIRGNPYFLDPLPFIKWAQEVTITLVNGVLSSIDWDAVYTTLPIDIQGKIQARNETYEQGFDQLLGGPEEPIYF